MKVVLTAPMPGVRIPSFPFGGAILPGFSMQLLYGKDDLQTPIATTISRTKPERTCNDERSGKDLQIGPAICQKNRGPFEAAIKRITKQEPRRG
jgi:hypothetical protein